MGAAHGSSVLPPAFTPSWTMPLSARACFKRVQVTQRWCTLLQQGLQAGHLSAEQAPGPEDSAGSRALPAGTCPPGWWGPCWQQRPHPVRLPTTPSVAALHMHALGDRSHGGIHPVGAYVGSLRSHCLSRAASLCNSDSRQSSCSTCYISRALSKWPCIGLLQGITDPRFMLTANTGEQGGGRRCRRSDLRAMSALTMSGRFALHLSRRAYPGEAAPWE